MELSRQGLGCRLLLACFRSGAPRLDFVLVRRTRSGSTRSMDEARDRTGRTVRGGHHLGNGCPSPPCWPGGNGWISRGRDAEDFRCCTRQRAENPKPTPNRIARPRSRTRVPTPSHPTSPRKRPPPPPPNSIPFNTHHPVTTIKTTRWKDKPVKQQLLRKHLFPRRPKTKK